ncbi:cyclic pyranopterin monophosphate synthase MoaC [Poriferisphaera sp. WC338]|uniref:cyclic pyranopterin monophosphate synthase MoaC n=1 Tax=Poriferisphaera sp. WC338 TaxID=3425129 RepID=UPI003D815B99
MTEKLSHVDDQGRASMVDVGKKMETKRHAVAAAEVHASAALVKAVQDEAVKKGNVIEVARLAGIMGGKQTSNLIPLCHPLPLDHLGVEIEIRGNVFYLTATASTTAKTGVEMEALAAVTIAALTVYDMGKAIDKTMAISNIRLLEKSGGKSGTFHRDDE